MNKILFFLFAFFLSGIVSAQNMGIITGNIKDKYTQEPLKGVVITLSGADSLNTLSDENGNFKLEAISGAYNLMATCIGYKNFLLYNINLTSGNAQILPIEMEIEAKKLENIVINSFKTVRATGMITPLSTQKLTAEEIKVNPGGNFDVSKVIQVLPGVGGGTTPSRNDIIVRGGGPSENVYYLDGIEIPVLNHFQTQGASGGATGILNVSFISDVQLTSSAFDSRYDNTLSSTIVIKQRNGNPNRLSGNLRLSGSEFATTLEGPLGKKTTFLASARRSYLQFLFGLLDLPIRPDYWDFQYKINHKIDKKTELTFIGLGAIDHFKLAVPKNTDAENEYTIRSNPLLKQWDYTIGGLLKRLINNGYYTIALSRNMLFNGADRYADNALKSGPKLYSLESFETENKLRLDVNTFNEGWKVSYGIDAQYVKYSASIFNTIQLPVLDGSGNVITPGKTEKSNAAIDFYKLGAFVQVSKYFFDEKFLVSAGSRVDINSFTTTGWDPLKTFSPRLSFSYKINDNWDVSASVGSYFKIPVYTSLGYKDTLGIYANKSLKYINAIHYTIGTQFIPRNDLRITLDAFYKQYRNYPVSLTTGISLADLGTDFSPVGTDALTSTGKGRVYGVEAYIQQKLVKRLFYILSATVYKSEFSGADGKHLPSTWDFGYIISSTLGYKFKKNWELGLKYRIAGGQPYTPFDMAASRAAYLTKGQGVYDYSLLNSEQLPLFQQLDLRIDKKFNFRKTSLDLYLDFQNILFYKTPYKPNYTFQRNNDNTGFATTDGNPISSDGSNAIPVILQKRNATIVPSIGFIFEF